MKNMKKKVIRKIKKFSVLFFFLCTYTNLSAGENNMRTQSLFVEIGGSPNPVGSGARALGMGGAFICVADDATAASWNPGGLIQLETPEISIVGAHVERSVNTDFQAFPDMSGDNGNSDTRLNYISAVYPFSLMNHNTVISLNLQHMYDLNNAFNKLERYKATTPIPQEYEKKHNYSQKGGWYTLTPAFSIQLFPRLSMGLSMNFWNEGWLGEEWKISKHTTGNGIFNEFDIKLVEDVRQTCTFSGFNWQFGLLWNISRTLTLGAVYKSSFKADFETQSVYHLSTTTSSDQLDRLYTSDSADQLELPLSFGLGLSARLNDNLTLALDAYHTKWSDYKIITSSGDSYNPVSGNPGEEETSENVKDTIQIRAGAEYLFLGEKFIIPLRGGIFYDPEPSGGSPDDFLGFSLGSGIAFKNIVFDMALQYRYGNNVREKRVAGEPVTQEVDSVTMYTSFIYHF